MVVFLFVRAYLQVNKKQIGRHLVDKKMFTECTILKFLGHHLHSGLYQQNQLFHTPVSQKLWIKSVYMFLRHSDIIKRANKQIFK